MKTVELSLKEFLIVALRRWLPILLCALIVAATLGAQSYLSLFGAADELRERYNKELTSYEQILKAKRESMISLAEKRTVADEYNQKSVLMHLDPYNKQTSIISMSVDVEPSVFYLSTDSQQTLGLVELKAALIERIVDHYLIVVGNAKLEDVLKNDLPTEYEEKYLREIIAINREAGGIITIRSLGNSELDASLLVESLYQYLLGNQKLIADSVAEHTVTVIGRSSRVEVDTALADYQSAQRNSISEYSKQIVGLLNDIKTLINEKPSLETLGFNVVKNTFVGILIGAVVGIMFVLLSYTARLPIQVSEQIQRQLGIRHLGGIPHRSRTLIGRLGDRVAGEAVSVSEATALDIISANISEVVADHKRVLVTGTVQESILADFTQKMNALSNETESDLLFTYGNDINVSASTIRELMASDAVILVERIDASRLRDISKEIERIKLSNKEILGYVLC